MGLFTRNTMPLGDMAKLVGFVASCSVMFYGKYGAWPDYDYRTDVVHKWLSDTGHRASAFKLTKLCAFADNVARHALATVPDIADQLVYGEDEVRTGAAESLVMLGEHILLAKGVTK